MDLAAVDEAVEIGPQVLGHPVDLYLEVQVGPGGITGASHPSYELQLLYALALGHTDVAEMGVHGLVAVGVGKDDVVPVGIVPPFGLEDRAGIRGIDAGAFPVRDIHGMEPGVGARIPGGVRDEPCGGHHEPSFGVSLRQGPCSLGPHLCHGFLQVGLLDDLLADHYAVNAGDVGVDLLPAVGAVGGGEQFSDVIVIAVVFLYLKGDHGLVIHFLHRHQVEFQ